MKLNSKHTISAACIGYLTQAVTINFPPLLFLTFEKSYGISMGKISMLIAISFFTQLLTDIFVAEFNKLLNTRVWIITAHLCSVVGMISFAFIPELMPDPYVGLIISTVIAALGSGIIEVLISPIVESCPSKNKSATMSILHSFYCWGYAGVVLISTLFFFLIGIENWKILACVWAIVPAIGALAFCLVPLFDIEGGSGGESADIGAKKPISVFRSGIFWVFFIMMFASGAAEQAMSQWASNFAEAGLGVSKSMGDLLGPFAFAVFMGSSRLFYGKTGGKLKLTRFITVSSVICVISYLVTALSPHPLMSLVGCAVCGLSVGIMWPGTYSLATATLTNGGVRMFAMLAIAGDLGCLAGPTAAGWIAEAFGNDLKISFLFCTISPVSIILLMQYVLRIRKKIKSKK